MRVFVLCLLLLAAPLLAAVPDPAAMKAFEAANDRARAQYDGGNKPEGVRLFEEAVAQGNPVSKLTLGWLLLNATDVPARDPARGIRLYEESAAAGVAMSAFNLGHHYAQGSAVPKDQAKALAWFQKAADLGLAQAMSTVAWYHHSNAAGTGLNDQKSVEWNRRAAEAGDAEGMRGLGVAYMDGRGIGKDIEQARRWLGQSAALGNVAAKSHLDALPPPAPVNNFYDPARFTYPGHDLYTQFEKKDPTTPEYIAAMQSAAEKGHPAAQTAMAYAYSMGRGVPEDAERARSMFQVLAEKGCGPCELIVGRWAMSGRGGPKDVDASRYWLEKAANRNVASAMSSLGTLYDPRNNYIPNLQLAIFWNQAAADRGDGHGYMWLKERGYLPQSPEQQSFLARIDSQGPNKSDPATYNYEVAVYCQYGGRQCDQLRAQAYRDEQANNRAAEGANLSRIWSVYRREAADPDVRSQCLRKKSESIWRSNSGKQDWYYAGDC